MAQQTLNAFPITCDACYLLTVESTDYVSGTVTLIYGYTDRYFNFTKLGDIGTIAADGNNSFNIDITGDLTVPQSVLDAQCNNGVMANFAIQYNDDANVALSFGHLIIDPTCDIEKYVSTCYSLSDSCACDSMLFEWTNDIDAFGFDYTGFGFNQSLRVRGLKWFSSFPEENNQYVGSSGVNTLISATSWEVEEVLLDELPRWLHDTVRLARLHRFFNIDGVPYFALAQTYEPEFDQYRKLAQSRFEVRKKVENNQNDNC